MDNSEVSNKIGQILKLIRNKKKQTQYDVALKSGLSIRHYQNIEYGKIKCQMDTLSKILSIYELTIFNFFTEFVLEHYYHDGVEILYDLFGNNYFGFRRFDFEGTCIYQNEYDELITGMKYEDVVGKVKLWDDVEDEKLKNFIALSFKYFIKTLPRNFSMKVDIKNHLLGTSKTYMGYYRFEKNKAGKKIAIEVIIIPFFNSSKNEFPV
jgi:transcriptional regulator with XRE-family HTH domain